jgi:hypothetical protein
MYAQNYDPSSYDPSNFDGMSNSMPSLNVSSPNTPVIDGVTRMQGNNLAQLDLTITNSQASAAVAQLFNYINSVALVNNAAISTLNPFTALDVAAANQNSLNDFSTCFFLSRTCVDFGL